MRQPNDREVVRKVKLSDVTMTVTTEAEPDDIHEAIADALSGVSLDDYNIDETFTVEAYGHEIVIGESNES